MWEIWRERLRTKGYRGWSDRRNLRTVLRVLQHRMTVALTD